jgi:hypothetical protein
MAYLLRKLPDKNAWAEVADSPLWEHGDCPSEALWQVFDNRRSVSTWRVNTRDEEERVIVAQAFLGRSIPSDFFYFLINEQELRQAGIAMKNSTAKTFDKNVDGCHVDIIELSGKQLIQFAHLLNTKFEPKVVTRTEILEIAARHFRTKNFDREFLFTSKGNRGRSEEEIALSRTLLVNLWKQAAIDISIVTSSES